MCFLSSVDVARDRLVTELGELDAHLVRGDAVRAVADDGPRAAARARCVARSSAIDAAPADAARTSRRAARAAPRAVRGGTARRSALSSPSSAAIANASRKHGRDLRVEGLRRRHAHLDVATVGGEEHAVGLVDEVALAPVHDRDHERAARPREIDRAVRVGRRSRLRRSRRRACRSCRRASPKPESSVASVASIVDRAPGDRAPQRLHETLARDRGGALPDHEHAPDRRPTRSASTHARRATSPAGAARRAARRARRSWPRSVLRNDAGASVISFRR